MPRQFLGGLPQDFWIGAGMALLGAIGILLIPLQVGPLTADRSILPLIGAAGCLAFGLCLSLQTWRNGVREPPGSQLEELQPSHAARFAGAFIVIVLHALLLGPLGLLVVGVSVQIMLFLLLGIRRPAVILLVSLASVGVLYAGITLLLGVPLPEGTLLRGLL